MADPRPTTKNIHVIDAAQHAADSLLFVATRVQDADVKKMCLETMRTLGEKFPILSPGPCVTAELSS